MQDKATNSLFEASRDRSERNRFRGRRAAFSDYRYGGGYTAQDARDLAREAKTAREREYYIGYADTMVEFGKR
jgi:DNA invertase Pin-like site-specific DNA recombinase